MDRGRARQVEHAKIRGESTLTRGGASIRTRFLLTAILAVTPCVLPAASTEAIVLLLEGSRKEIAPVVRGEIELVPLDLVIAGLGIAVHPDATAGAVTLTYQGREASLYNKKSLASVGGELRLLSSPALLEGGIWLVPVDGIPRLLGPLLAQRAEWRPASRTLLIGSVAVPRVGVNTFVSGDLVRVVLDASEKIPFRVVQQEGRVLVSIPRDAVEVAFQQERLTGGIVDWVQYQGGRDNVVSVTLGRRFQQMKAYEQEGPPRLVLEFHAAPTVAHVAPGPAPGPSVPARPQAPEEPRQRTIVLDPGHGGDDTGAKGPAGTLEKDVALSIARKLRAAIVGSLGYQVFLTRDKDEDIPLDERAAIANNYKADLFVSIHANASRSHGANGSEVYFLSYQASDEESRRVAMTEGNTPPPAGVEAAPGGGDLALILWDMAQAEHLEESSVLASRLQEELAGVTGAPTRGVKQAPFRVLVGAAMPAALVEIAFISNPDEEKLLAADAFQNRVAGAILKGLSRYEGDETRRTDSVVAAPRSASP